MGALADGDTDHDFLGPVQPDAVMQKVAEGTQHLPSQTWNAMYTICPVTDVMLMHHVIALHLCPCCIGHTLAQSPLHVVPDTESPSSFQSHDVCFKRHKRHLYSGNLLSETPGDSKNVFLHCGCVLVSMASGFAPGCRVRRLLLCSLKSVNSSFLFWHWGLLCR